MGSGCGLTAAQRIADVLPEFPQGSQLTSVGAAIAGDCDILVYLYDRKYFIFTVYLSSSFLGRI